MEHLFDLVLKLIVEKKCLFISHDIHSLPRIWMNISEIPKAKTLEILQTLQFPTPINQ